LYIEPRTPEALAAAVAVLRDCGVPYFFIGRGTNLLVTDEGVRGAVVSLYPGLGYLRVEKTRVVAAAGVPLGKLCHVAAHANLGGAEFAAGIPGSVGGALSMNAGANGGCIGDLIEEVVVLDAEGQIQRRSRGDLQFGYRFSSLTQEGLCCLEATFRLTPSSAQLIHQRMYETIQRRCAKQPLGARSAGSIFKRPPGDYAGRLLEEAGAKGLSVGGAEISHKHANFIINTGSATALDVLRLIRLAQRTVYERFGVWLEPEVRVLGVLPEEFADDNLGLLQASAMPGGRRS